MNRQQAIDIIKERRKELNISQTAIAEAVHTFKGDISNIEAGKVNISLDRYLAICNALHLEVIVSGVKQCDL